MLLLFLFFSCFIVRLICFCAICKFFDTLSNSSLVNTLPNPIKHPSLLVLLLSLFLFLLLLSLLLLFLSKSANAPACPLLFLLFALISISISISTSLLLLSSFLFIALTITFKISSIFSLINEFNGRQYLINSLLFFGKLKQICFKIFLGNTTCNDSSISRAFLSLQSYNSFKTQIFSSLDKYQPFLRHNVCQPFELNLGLIYTCKQVSSEFANTFNKKSR